MLNVKIANGTREKSLFWIKIFVQPVENLYGYQHKDTVRKGGLSQIPRLRSVRIPLLSSSKIEKFLLLVLFAPRSVRKNFRKSNQIVN